MKDIELLPCPFCGAACHFEKDAGAWEWVECESCGMQGNRSASLMEDCKPLLAEAWNRRAAVDADRAQRVPEGWAPAAIQGPSRTVFYGGYSNEHKNPLVVLISADDYEKCRLLASTPAQPAQQEPRPFNAATLAQIAAVRPDLIPQMHGILAPAAQHQEPPQPVERKPMTDEVAREGFAACGVGGINARLGFVEGVKFTERYHGIREYPPC